ncbi:DEAD/DEAH box helicase [Thalassorhabdus alkalitolerans]|uniref:DEAD/DEAH box helicase n=1 Tax=Thalassorhabdus alkalitolerans TaxID=2282697 RepID=A0ABW0YG05_9BACI
MKFALVEWPDPFGRNHPYFLPEAWIPSSAILKKDPQSISFYRETPSIEINRAFTPQTDIRSLLAGKELLPDELPFSFQILRDSYFNGYIYLKKGIEKSAKGYHCHRCGNHGKTITFAQVPCARCERLCVYCRNCITMGRVAECTPLIGWKGASPQEGKKCDSLLAWEGEFSPGQKIAVTEIENRVGTEQELLLWAVCGAGKTEILFPGLEKALLLGQRVLLATPRTDVVLELLPRMKKAFPDVKVTGLYGGSEDRDVWGQLVIATTHQVRRFKDAFDLVIVDEVDAFPYTFDKSLAFGIQKAKKKSAAVFYLTATPSTDLKKRVQQKKLEAVKIPRRYHGHPLPEPHFAWTGNWKKTLEKKKLPHALRDWCRKRLDSETQAFVFVPTVKVLHQITPLLQKINSNIQGVHAEDTERRGKVQDFREGKIPLLVTTTILERGVTVKGIEVAVLGAEETIFDESALVQIAGRAGRSADHPTGDVVYFHYGKSNAMLAARRHIKQMNKANIL